MEHTQSQALAEAARWMAEASAAAKCWPCGCLHSTLKTLEAATWDPSPELQPLRDKLASARAKLRSVEYECLGCATCYPALAANAYAAGDPDRAVALAACPTDTPGERTGWPPFPGEYRVLRYQAPVAICTLTDGDLTGHLAAAHPSGVALVGRLQTENLGIERIIHNGTDERGRILRGKGKRPLIRNISREAVDAFRKQVEVVDLIGCEAASEILAALAVCVVQDPGPAAPFAGLPAIPRTAARPPVRLVLDPAGYFVIFPDARRGILVLEHYRNDGVLDHVLEGRTPAELYATAIELGLLTRLDHAAYLGQELARAELALRAGEVFVQDAAPDEVPASMAPEATPSGHT